MVVVAGINLEKDCQVASSFVKRAFNRGAEVVVIGSAGKNVDKRATKRYRNWNEKVTTALQEGANPVLLYGGGVDSQQLRRIRELCPEIKCVGLANGVNSRGLEREGIPLWEGKEIEKAVYVIACDETLDERLEFNLRKAEFIIVQSAFETSLTRKAHVVLPSPSWQERSGTYINTEGMVRRLEGATLKAGSTKPDEYMLSRLLERRMG
ncbi:MAG: formate dehydrogenase major subunit [Thermovirga sp.]|nr:formate dehydrogenase major subunit [Thermovirga sp.]